MTKFEQPPQSAELPRTPAVQQTPANPAVHGTPANAGGQPPTAGESPPAPGESPPVSGGQSSPNSGAPPAHDPLKIAREAEETIARLAVFLRDRGFVQETAFAGRGRLAARACSLPGAFEVFCDTPVWKSLRPQSQSAWNLISLGSFFFGLAARRVLASPEPLEDFYDELREALLEFLFLPTWTSLARDARGAPMDRTAPRFAYALWAAVRPKDKIWRLAQHGEALFARRLEDGTVELAVRAEFILAECTALRRLCGGGARSVGRALVEAGIVAPGANGRAATRIRILSNAVRVWVFTKNFVDEAVSLAACTTPLAMQGMEPEEYEREKAKCLSGATASGREEEVQPVVWSDPQEATDPPDPQDATDPSDLSDLSDLSDASAAPETLAQPPCQSPNYGRQAAEADGATQMYKAEEQGEDGGEDQGADQGAVEAPAQEQKKEEEIESRATSRDASAPGSADGTPARPRTVTQSGRTNCLEGKGMRISGHFVEGGVRERREGGADQGANAAGKR
jgi:hypothetical protein